VVIATLPDAVKVITPRRQLNTRAKLHAALQARAMLTQIFKSLIGLGHNGT
jgi:hypothetical protein